MTPAETPIRQTSAPVPSDPVVSLPPEQLDAVNTSHDAPHPQLVAAAAILVRWLLEELETNPEGIRLLRQTRVADTQTLPTALSVNGNFQTQNDVAAPQTKGGKHAF